MLIVSGPVERALVQELEDDFVQGAMIDASGRRMLNEEEIDRIGGMSVQIQSREHPPPHFHVRFKGENASFAIEDGRRLAGIRGLEAYDHNIRRWWARNRCELVHAWNRLRPSDCPVGPIDVPPECLAPQS